MDSESSDPKIFHKLMVERKKQIQREGVELIFQNRSYPQQKHFQFSPENRGRLEGLIKNKKFGLQFCNSEGKTFMNIMASDLYFKRDEPYKLYISSDIHQFRRIKSAKTNPTLQAYKSNYSSDHNKYEINEFFESEHIVNYFKGVTKEIKDQLSVNFPVQKDFNQRQNQAIRKSGKNSLTFIKGPPGCGKSKTISRLCRLFLQNKMKVIVGAVSNTGNLSIAQYLINELSEYNNTAILLKYEEQFREKNITGFYDLLAGFYDQHITKRLVFYPPFQMKQQDLTPLVRLYSFDTIVIKNMIKVSQNIDTLYLVREYQKIKDKNKIDSKFYAIMMQAIQKTVKQADIILATTVKSKTINSKIARNSYFTPDVAILDEASQSSCSDTLCYLKLNVSKLILVGDQKQLNPTVISNDKMLKQCFFTKFSQNKAEYFTMLNVQYRMHPLISRISNKLFYQSLIEDGVRIDKRSTDYQPFCNYPVIFINCKYNQQEQIQHSGRKIYVNFHQVYIIKAYLQCFPAFQMRNIGIITPYAQQLKLLQKQLYTQIKQYGLTVKTCDGFQGGEKDFIFISLVRSNQEGTIGFCGEQNRINVSITRARKGLMIIGNSNTFMKSDNYWGKIVDHIKSQYNAYFQFDLPIPKQQIQKIILSHKDKSGNLLRPQIEPFYYLSFEQYLYQFHRNYHQDDIQTLRDAYNLYVQQLYYKYQQRMLSPLQKKNKLIKLITEGIEQNSEEQNINTFIKKNSLQNKHLLELHVFFLNNRTKNKSELADNTIKNILYIFQALPNDVSIICNRLTNSVRKEYLEYFKQSQNLDPLQHLREIIVETLHQENLSTQKVHETVYEIIKWMLLKKLSDII